MKTPLIVTHPATLLHDGLRSMFSKSQFGPLFIVPKLTEELESQMRSFENCIWLIGVSRYDRTTDELLRRMTKSAPGVKSVILAAFHAPEDVMGALQAGASGFLRQDTSAEQLLKSLELIALGQAVLHRDLLSDRMASAPMPAKSETTQHVFQRDANNSGETSDSDHTPSLSRRELLVLRMLTEGASNKVIALKLVITESTVKVHMKAILRKLRLQNRTQVAMWARNHIHEDVWSGLSSSARGAASARQHSNDALPSFSC